MDGAQADFIELEREPPNDFTERDLDGSLSLGIDVDAMLVPAN